MSRRGAPGPAQLALLFALASGSAGTVEGAPSIASDQLPNGLRVLVLADSAAPMIEAGLWIGAGWVHNPRGREGLADLCAALDERRVRRAVLDRRAGKRYMAGAVSSHVEADHAEFGIQALAEDLDQALAALRLIPAPDEGEFGIAPALKRDALLNLLQNRLAPGLVAREALGAVLFGSRRPLGFSARFQTLLGVLPADVAAFHQAHYVPSNAILTVAGAVDPSAVRAAVRRRFGDWKGEPAEAPAWGRAADAPARPGITLIDHPDLTQAVIIAGLAAPGREDPDFTSVQLLNQALGSGRLEQDLAALAGARPEGYQYRTQLRTSARGSELTLEASVPHELAIEALGVLERGIDAFRRTGIDAGAFDAERAARASSLMLRYEVPGERLREAAALLLAGQPVAAAADPARALAAADPAAARALWGRLLDGARVVWVVVGRAQTLGPALEASGAQIARGDLYEVALGRLDPGGLGDGAGALPPAISTAQAEELIFSAIDAKGGFAALEQIETYALEDTVYVSPGPQVVSGTRSLRVRFPDQMREDLQMAALQGRGVVQVVNGGEVWRSQLGRIAETKETRRQDLLLRQWLDPFRLFHRYGEPGASAAIADLDLFGTVTLDGVEIRSAAGNWVRIYLHPESRLVVKQTTTRAMDTGPHEDEEQYTDYRPVGGVFVPFLTARYLDGELAGMNKLGSIDLNVPLDKGIFLGSP